MKKLGCAQCGGAMKKMQKGGQPNLTKTMAGYNATTRPMQMKKGGIKKYQPGGPMTQAPTTPPPAAQSTNKFNTPVGTNTFVKGGGAIKSSYKKGGSIKNAKLAALAAPKNKITRADVLTRILKKKKK